MSKLYSPHVVKEIQFMNRPANEIKVNGVMQILRYRGTIS